MSTKKSKSKAGGLLGALGTIVSGTELLKIAINATQGYAEKAIDDRKDLIPIPDLYHKGYRVTADQAKEALEKAGLSSTLVKLSLIDASPEYRDYTPLQVIETNPKAGHKVLPGSNVLVKYIPQEVIDESQAIFKREENKKAEAAKVKAEKREASKEKTRQAVNDTISVIKQTASKVASAPKKLPKVRRKNDEQES